MVLIEYPWYLHLQRFHMKNLHLATVIPKHSLCFPSLVPISQLLPTKQTSTLILLTMSLKRTSVSVADYCLQMPRTITGNSSKFWRRYELHIDVGGWAVEEIDFYVISCQSCPGLLSIPPMYRVPKHLPDQLL